MNGFEAQAKAREFRKVGYDAFAFWRKPPGEDRVLIVGRDPLKRCFYTGDFVVPPPGVFCAGDGEFFGRDRRRRLQLRPILTREPMPDLPVGPGYRMLVGWDYDWRNWLRAFVRPPANHRENTPAAVRHALREITTKMDPRLSIMAETINGIAAACED
jgi:hypothetical protein